MKKRVSIKILSTLLIISSLVLSACNLEDNPTNSTGETTAPTEEVSTAPTEEATTTPTEEATTAPTEEVTPGPQVGDTIVINLDDHELISLGTVDLVDEDDFSTDTFSLPADESPADFIGVDDDYAYYLKTVMLPMSNSTVEISLFRIDEDGTEESLHEFDVQGGKLQIPSGYIYENYFIYEAVSEDISIMSLDFRTGNEEELITGNISSFSIVDDVLRVAVQEYSAVDTILDLDNPLASHKYKLIEIDLETNRQTELTTGYDAYLLFASLNATEDTLVYPTIYDESGVTTLIYKSDDKEFILELGEANVSDAQASDDLIIWNVLTNIEDLRSSTTYFYDIDAAQLYKLEGNFNSDTIQFAVTEDGFYFVTMALSNGQFDTLYFYDEDSKTIAEVHEIDTSNSVTSQFSIDSEGNALIAIHENDVSKLYYFDKD